MNCNFFVTDFTSDAMSYIPPWATAGGGGGHYPAHMLPPQHSLHTQHTPTSAAHQHLPPVSSQQTPSHSPHPPVSSDSPHVFPSLSPKMLVTTSPLPINTTNIKTSDHNHHHLNQPVSSPSTQSSPADVAIASVTSLSNNINSQPPPLQHPPPSSTPNHPPPASTPHHTNPLELSTHQSYEPQGFHRNDISPPPKLHPADLRHDLASQLHSLPELALGIPGTSTSAEMKAHRKYVRR